MNKSEAAPVRDLELAEHEFRKLRGMIDVLFTAASEGGLDSLRESSLSGMLQAMDETAGNVAVALGLENKAVGAPT